MDTITRYYQPPSQVKIQPPPSRSINEHTNDALNPILNHRYAGFYPQMEPKKDVILKMDPAPATIFQHVPSFSHFPEHSNLDLYIVE